MCDFRLRLNISTMKIKIHPFAMLTLAVSLTACGTINIDSLVAVAPNLNTGSSTPAIPALTQQEAASGLKEALQQGVQNGVQLLNTPGAFNQNPINMIKLPQEVQDAVSKIHSNTILNATIGKEIDNQVAKAQEAMNVGAENAMIKASPIFTNAITNMSFSDALSILTGGNGAATTYLSNQTQSQLIAAFKPDIQQALDAVKITNYWKPIITAINNNKKALGLTSDLNPDLTAYVTEKATIALFNEIKNRENNLRSSLSNRSTDLLKKVFDFADKNKK